MQIPVSSQRPLRRSIPAYSHAGGIRHPSRRAVVAGLAASLATVMAGRRAFAAAPVKLVALGDSLTAGFRLGPKEGFAPKLEAALRARGRNVTVANAGVSGDTSSGGADRVDWSVPDGTDGVIVELGANDMLRGLSPAVTRKALARLLDRLKARNIPVMLAGMRASRNLGADYVREFERIYPELARERGLPLYPFFLEGVVNDRDLNLDDGVHPSARGVDVIVAGILPTVERFLDQNAAGRS